MDDFYTENFFSDLTWVANQPRWDAYIATQDPTISTMDVMSSEWNALIAPTEFRLQMAYKELESPPYKFGKEEGDEIIWDQATGSYKFVSTFTELE